MFLHCGQRVAIDQRFCSNRRVYEFFLCSLSVFDTTNVDHMRLPESIHFSNDLFLIVGQCAGPCSDGGIRECFVIRNDSQVNLTVVRQLPGSMAYSVASSKLSRRRSAWRLESSGPWQRKQRLERIGLMSRLKSISSAWIELKLCDAIAITIDSWTARHAKFSPITLFIETRHTKSVS